MLSDTFGLSGDSVSMEGPVSRRFGSLQIKNLRYSRLKTCATFSFGARATFSFEPALFSGPSLRYFQLGRPRYFQASSVLACGWAVAP